MSDTTRMVQRQAAIRRPTTANPEARTLEIVIATDRDIGDGVRLDLSRLPEHGHVVPVLLDHANRSSSMAGRLLDLRLENGALIGTAEFRDAPMAEQGWQMAQAGIGVSVGASYRLSDLRPGPGGVDIASPWTLREASLTPVPADLAAVTRSAPSLSSTPMSNDTQTTQATQADDDAPKDPQAARLERAAEKLELTIRRAAAEARLSAEQTQQIVDEHRASGDKTAALTAVVRAYREEVERKWPAHAGHPARIATPTGQPGGLEGVIHRALRGERSDQPLWMTLKQEGLGRGNDALSVWRSALSGDSRWISRSGGFMSTSDLPLLLTASGDRRLQERFAVADAGIRMAASIRQLADYRAAAVADVGMIGTAQKILEGGEIKFASINESAATYKPTRYGLGLALSPESLANDDLAALDQAIGELADAMIDAECGVLVDLLEGAANGRNAPDGKALFHADHSNTVATGPLGLAAIGSAVAKMRNQKALGGRFIQVEPAVMLVGTDHETTARQLLSDAINAAQADDVNPWRNLQIAVEPRLSGTYSYIIGTGRKPLELGRLTEGPALMQDTEFSTSAVRWKVEHAFGAIVAEHRTIVRMTNAAN